MVVRSRPPVLVVLIALAVVGLGALPAAAAAKRRASCRHVHGRRHCAAIRLHSTRPTASASSESQSSGILVLKADPLPSPAPWVPLSIPCAGAYLVPTRANTATVEAATLCLIDQVRELGGLDPLAANPSLHVAALGHSVDMVTNDYFAHETPGSGDLLARVTAAGYVLSTAFGYILGENIAWGAASNSTPAATVANWLASPEHRANILDATYRDTGIGVVAALPKAVAPGYSGATYTEDFGDVDIG
jgi:uncharacterized protein YkwD